MSGTWDLALALAFDRDDTEFAHGVEVGSLWQQLKVDPASPVSASVHGANAEMMVRLSEATHRPLTTDEIDLDWLAVTFGPAVATADDDPEYPW